MRLWRKLSLWMSALADGRWFISGSGVAEARSACNRARRLTRGRRLFARNHFRPFSLGHCAEDAQGAGQRQGQRPAPIQPVVAAEVTTRLILLESAPGRAGIPPSCIENSRDLV